MAVIRTISSGEVPVKVHGEQLDDVAEQQIQNLSRLPIIHSHVAIMPDAHAGKGIPIGSVIPTYKAVIPAAVGVDIGCGMIAHRLSIDTGRLPDSLRPVRNAIEETIPVGFSRHKEPKAPKRVTNKLSSGLEQILYTHPQVTKRMRDPEQTWKLQIGTLGGGNHFIELCADESNFLWVMLHSGSRGIGNALGMYFIELAKADMRIHHLNVPHRDLSYLRAGTQYFDDYVAAVEWAQVYARENRKLMMDLILKVLKKHLPPFEVKDEAINCHHNYVAREKHFGKQVYITRKGAIRAGKGELGIVPGSMGTCSYIVRGKGNADAFDSSAHGAGRVMSRRAAYRRFNMADVQAQTAGVECRKDKKIRDELPQAYKDIDTVMQHQSDLVDIVHKLRPLLCVKG